MAEQNQGEQSDEQQDDSQDKKQPQADPNAAKPEGAILDDDGKLAENQEPATGKNNPRNV
jgi:hypothetical protein